MVDMVNDMVADMVDMVDDMVYMVDDIVDDIVDRESGDHMTLMHRFNGCADLIRGVMDGNFGGDRARGLSTLFVWLRYSSMRQLTWQRNYNTQPRILAGAQENLTLALTRTVRETADDGPAQQWARMCLSCVGKGGSNVRVVAVGCTVVGPVAVWCSWARSTATLRSQKFLSLFRLSGAATRLKGLSEIETRIE